MKYAVLSTTAVAVVTAALCSAQPASAQDFGRMLGRLAERTVERGARNVIDEATRPDDRPRNGPAERAPTSGGATPEAPASGSSLIPAPAGVEPWPINAGHRAIRIPSDFAFSPEMMAQKQAYNEASRFACSTCEASIEIDSWQKALRPLRDTYSEWGNLIAGWTVGRTIDWRGQHLDGRITVISEVPVGGFNCRQIRHRISTRERNPRVTETPGLICLGKRDQYSGQETWHSVF